MATFDVERTIEDMIREDIIYGKYADAVSEALRSEDLLDALRPIAKKYEDCVYEVRKCTYYYGHACRKTIVRDLKLLLEGVDSIELLVDEIYDSGLRHSSDKVKDLESSVRWMGKKIKGIIDETEKFVEDMNRMYSKCDSLPPSGISDFLKSSVGRVYSSYDVDKAENVRAVIDMIIAMASELDHKRKVFYNGNLTGVDCVPEFSKFKEHLKKVHSSLLDVASLLSDGKAKEGVERLKKVVRHFVDRANNLIRVYERKIDLLHSYRD